MSVSEQHYARMAAAAESQRIAVAVGDQVRLLAATLRNRRRGAPMPMWQARADAAQRLLVLAMQERQALKRNLAIVGEALRLSDDDESID